MSHLINRVFSYLESRSSNTCISLFKTLYVNFRTLPFKQAIKFPIYIYGRVKFYSLEGDIVIQGRITRGMIKLGYKQGLFSAPKGSAMILLASGTKLIFNGPCMFDFDYAIRITEKGVVNIGGYIGFGSDTKIYCEESITIGDYCRVPFGTCFMYTNYHYSINTMTGKIHRKSAPVHIGRYNWIGNTSTIMKGTQTPDGAIIASKSFLNKDYVNLGNGKENIVLAGAPAKIVQNDCTRIISLEIERSVNDWFMTHLDQISYCNEQALKRCKENGQYCKLFER